MALPGNRGVLFTQCRPDCLTSALAVVDLHTGDVQTLIDGAIGGWYLPDGYLVYAQASGSVFGVRFDVDGLEVKGAPIPLLDGLSMSIVVPLPRMAVSPSGTAAYLPGVSPTRRRLVRVHWDGSEDTLSAEARSFDEPRISPSGRQVAVGIWEAGLQQVWIYDIPSGTLTQLNSTTANTQPTWSSDGKRVAYSAWVGDRGWAVRWRDADRSDEPTVVAPESVLSRRAWDLDWSQEGHWIAAAGVRHGADKDIFAIPAEGHAEMVPVVAAPGNESDPAISPDGHWIAYESGASGTTQVYAHPFPEPGGHWVVSAGLGWDPKWSPDGRSIFYSTGTEIWVASIHYKTFQVTDRRRLFESRMYMRDFDVGPDGRSFIMIREQQPPITDPIVILNWSREIEGRIASQKER
jgi:Tol biopolymer transport system component